MTASAEQATRDWRTWPFSSGSPWNMPIGSNAQYADVPGLAALPASINFNDRWTSSVIISKTTDPVAHVWVNTSWPTTNWKFLAGGKPNCGNTASDEITILTHVKASAQIYPANPWSTLSPVEKDWQLPAGYHPASDHFQPKAYLRAGSCPSPDTDGLMADFQPDGWVLDTYATIVLGSGDIVSDGVASYIDARGDGTGWWNGRRASMLPSFAGLIRNGEIARGHIPHALAVLMYTHMMAKRAIWPAAAYDRHADDYRGTLPMGALLAIPANVDIRRLGLTPTGLILARAAQDYGAYVVDTSGGAGISFLAELNNPDIRWPGWDRDMPLIARQLRQITNNSAATPGGGGTLRAPSAPPLAP